MGRFGTICAAVALLAAPASADEILGSYYTSIGPNDFFNSRGVRLTDACAILQQDRANFHRFGIRDDGDQSDPYFRTPNARSVIGRNCRVYGGSEYVAVALHEGRRKYVYVEIHGVGGRPTHVMFAEGAG